MQCLHAVYAEDWSVTAAMIVVIGYVVTVMLKDKKKMVFFLFFNV
jgi:hypothetical protein